MAENNLSVKVELATENLNRLIDWIKHSDNKIALINIFYAGLITFLINKTGDIVKIIKNNTFGWLQFILYFSIILFFFLLFKSVYKSFKALYPDIEMRDSSMFYFGSIAKQGKERFNKDFNELEDEEVLNQLNSQVYINSQIAFNKFECVRQSIKSLYACAIFWILILIFTAILV